MQFDVKIMNGMYRGFPFHKIQQTAGATYETDGQHFMNEKRKNITSWETELWVFLNMLQDSEHYSVRLINTINDSK